MKTLHAWEMTDVDIRMLVAYRVLVRIRTGWYALPDTDAAVVDACRRGGRLACVSALGHHGIDVAGDGRLHIELRANAVLRRSDGSPESVRVHWTRHPVRGTTAAVDASAAWAQAIACGLCPPP